MRLLFQFLRLGSVCLAISVYPGRCGADDDLTGIRRHLDSTYRGQLAKLAGAAVEQGQDTLAARIGRWLPPRVAGRIVLFNPVDCTHKTDPNGPLLDHFARLRADRADVLFDLARRAAEAGKPAMAMQLAVETVRENPNHAEARRVLGHERVGDRWLTPYARRKADSGDIWHERFGWIRADHVARYESGQRPRGRQWISAADDARRHAAMNDGWVARTEHFSITTNAGLEAGVRLATQLETLHAAGDAG